MPKSIDELKTGGYAEVEIAKMLDIPIMDVYAHLSGEKPYLPTVSDTEETTESEDLKGNLLKAAKVAVSQIENNLRGNKDAVEVSKLTDSLAKTFTAFFKEDKGTQINIMQNNLSMFKDSLKR